jgi:tetratricopeptide (TPR) repeat protein
MRAKLGEPLASIQKVARPRLDVTTPSLEALKAFQRGQALNNQGLAAEAIPYFQRAVELDPNFASAYMFLGVAYNNTGQMGLRNEASAKAFSLVDHVSERERLFITGYYYRNVTQEWDKSTEALQLLVRSFPRFVGGHHLLGINYQIKGEYEKALEQHLENALVDPTEANFQAVLMEDYIALDRFEEAKSVAQRAFAAKLTSPFLHRLLLRIAYMQNDRVTQEQETRWLVDHAGESRILNEQLIDATIHGQRRKARQILQRTAEVQRASGEGQPSPVTALDWAFGICEGAARGGTTNPACMDVPALRLAEEARTRKPPPNPDASGLVFQRAKLAMAAGEAQKAASEFQKIVDHKGRNWNGFYPLAHLFLARAAATAGQTAKARRAYQDFLILWKDADSDLTYLSQARKELEELP